MIGLSLDIMSMIYAFAYNTLKNNEIMKYPNASFIHLLDLLLLLALNFFLEEDVDPLSSCCHFTLRSSNILTQRVSVFRNIDEEE
jgi:hypothetical protein